VTSNELQPDPIPETDMPKGVPHSAVPRPALRWLELLAIFFAVPAFVAVFLDPAQRLRPWFDASGADTIFTALRAAAGMIIPILLIFTVIVTVVLARDKTFDNRRLWNPRALRRDLPRILSLLALAAPALLGAAWLLATRTGIMTVSLPDGTVRSAFLYLPRQYPIFLFVLLPAYTLFSAYPQEILSRAFFFHRYRALFPSTAAAVTVNALAFMWLHCPFWSLEAFALTLPGGFLFAWTYLRTNSALAAGIEHGLYGWWAFLTGLGWFVFTGSIGT
jgi:membrane protease YdiL (CAAX protease family)